MNIDCVIIGLNAEKTLGRCIDSVIRNRFTRGQVHIYYVDGGSTDRSVEVARSFSEVEVIEITPQYPSPGMGRNAGWRSGSSPVVQFLDSDTILHPDWLEKAVNAMETETGAIRGRCDEINPETSIFNWIGNLEWNVLPGECNAFGGNALIRRAALEETGGYDEILVNGEDPELSCRVREKGWKIFHLDAPMVLHDLGMTRFIQYWNRSYRTGYGYAAVFDRIDRDTATTSKILRILVRGGGFLLLAGIIGSYWSFASVALLIPAVLLLFYPTLFRITHLMNEKQISFQDAKKYSYHCSFVALPQFIGIIRYYFGKLIKKPLRNNSFASNRRMNKIIPDKRKDGGTSLKTAYLVSEYPAISHTFIFREICELRKHGMQISTASVNTPRYLEKMTEEEKKEHQATFYIKKHPLLKIFQSHFNLISKSGRAYLAMLKKTMGYSFRSSQGFFKSFFYFAEAGILLQWMTDNRIKHVHVHFANPAATVAMIAAAYGTISYSLSVHGPAIFDNVQANLLSEKIQNAKFVRCISYYCQSQLMRLVPYDCWSKFHIVRCGIEPHVFSLRPEPENRIPEILCVGRLVPDKGFYTLLEACTILKEQGVEYHLTCVGGGEARSSLETFSRQAGISERVAFTGAVGQGKIQDYYNRADIFVLASFAEGVPVVLMEAMSKGIPCVSTRITGIPELITEGEEGLLVYPSDPKSLAMMLKKMLEDSCLRLKLGNNGRKKVMHEFDLGYNSKKMVKLFEQLTH